MRVMSRWIAVLALVFGFSTVVVAQDSPSAVIKDGLNELLAVLKDKSLDQEARREQMRGMIAERFDFDAMSRSILARNWKKASGEQRTQFIALFQTMLENTYMTAIETYTSEKVHFGKERVKGKRASVGVSIELVSGSTAPLSFRLVNRTGKWGVYDVVIEGVSLVNNFRSTYGSIVKRDGMEGLLAQMEAKLGNS